MQYAVGLLFSTEDVDNESAMQQYLVESGL